MSVNINFDYKNLSPFKWFVLENFPFIEADFDALTEWQLFCKIGKEINKIIDSQNVVGEQAETLTNAFNTLYNYVHDYFENLDVQDEINNKLNEMTESGELQQIVGEYLFDFWITPKAYGAKLDGVTDDTQAITQALQNGNVKFPSNSTVRIENLSIPNNRIIDFNMSNVKSNGTAIKIGSLNDTNYNKKVTIKNASFDVGTNAIDLTQCIFVKIENCYLPSLKNGNKFIKQINCFNVYIKDCSVGDFTPSIVENTYGIFVDCVSGGIVGTNNNTNLSIENCLLQRLKEGISLNTTNGLIDTVSMRNIGFSDNDIAILLNSNNVRNVNINCMRNEFCRQGIVNKGRLILSGMESYSTNEAINNEGQLNISNIDLRGQGIGITSNGSLTIANSVSADNDITFNILYANKPYNVFPVLNHSGVPNDCISQIYNYNIFQLDDFNISDLSTNCPDGSELTLNTSNGFIINGINTKYVIPEKGSVILKKISGGWGVIGYGANTNSPAPTAGNKVTLNTYKIRIIGALVLLSYDITVNTEITQEGEIILSNLPVPVTSNNYNNINNASVNITPNGDLKTWYNGNIPAGNYRGNVIYSL